MAKLYKTKTEIKVLRFEEAQGFYTTKKRSILMSKIKGKSTSPERLFRKALWREGIRYRTNDPNLPGKPDIVSKKYMLIIFIDGEFWHGYNWEKKKKKIKSNRAFWIPKIERNMERDVQYTEMLEKMGYKVFRFWEFQVKKEPLQCLTLVMEYVKGYNL